MRYVHRKDTPDGPRYRIWSTVIDRYYGPAMTRDETAAYLDDDDARWGIEAGFARARTAGVLARVDANGTSDRFGVRDPADPWWTEVCEGCGNFHHGYQPSADGSCHECGGVQSDPGHDTPCVVTPDDDDPPAR